MKRDSERPAAYIGKWEALPGEYSWMVWGSYAEKLAIILGSSSVTNFVYIGNSKKYEVNA